jgi:hypothetical protein
MNHSEIVLSKLDDAGLLFQVLERFRNVNLDPDHVDNATMGTIFEELIRRFNEALNENPGEHLTPRDVVHLMVDLMLAGDENRIRARGVVRTVYDPCCGSGGMLMIAKEHIKIGVRRNGDLDQESGFSALAERDETADAVTDTNGAPEPEPELHDTESVPLSEDICTFFDREVKPHVPDAWVDTDRRDEREGEVGLVGYEINFNRYFYRYKPPRLLEEIEADIKAIEGDILRMLAAVTGSDVTNR